MKTKHELKTLDEQILRKQATIRQVAELRDGESCLMSLAKRDLTKAQERVGFYQGIIDRAPDTLRRLEDDIASLLLKKAESSNLPKTEIEKKVRRRAKIMRELAEIDRELSQENASSELETL